MSFQSWLDVSGHNECDKCKKEMNAGAPGVEMIASCREFPRQTIWIHIKCLEKIAVRHKAGMETGEEKGG
jgi:hypothetical protein